MGFRRRTRRRALVLGAVAGRAMAHQATTQPRQQQTPADDDQDQTQYAPSPADPADEIEHLAQLHASGAHSFTGGK